MSRTTKMIKQEIAALESAITKLLQSKTKKKHVRSNYHLMAQRLNMLYIQQARATLAPSPELDARLKKAKKSNKAKHRKARK